MGQNCGSSQVADQRIPRRTWHVVGNPENNQTGLPVSIALGTPNGSQGTSEPSRQRTAVPAEYKQPLEKITGNNKGEKIVSKETNESIRTVVGVIKIIACIIFLAMLAWYAFAPKHLHINDEKKMAGFGVIEDGSLYHIVGLFASHRGYHEIYQDDELGYRIGRIGGISFLLNNLGAEVSGGFHSFFKKDGVIYGRLGATTEVAIDADGKPNWHTIEQNFYRYERK